MTTTQTLDIFMLFDLVILVGGVYFIYAALMLRFRNKVSTSLMLPKELQFKKCRDIENYKKYMWFRTLISGVILLISGVLCCLGDVYPVLDKVARWFFIPGFMSLVWFAIFSKKANEQFFK